MGWGEDVAHIPPISYPILPPPPTVSFQFIRPEAVAFFFIIILFLRNRNGYGRINCQQYVQVGLASVGVDAVEHASHCVSYSK